MHTSSISTSLMELTLPFVRVNTGTVKDLQLPFGAKPLSVLRLATFIYDLNLMLLYRLGERSEKSMEPAAVELLISPFFG